MIPYGADSSFWAVARITKIQSPFQMPRALKFTDYRSVIEAFINNGGTTNPVAGLP